MLKGLSQILKKDQPVVVPVIEVAPSVEELFSIEASEAALVSLEQSSSGGLVAVEDLDTKEISVETLLVEETIKPSSGPTCVQNGTLPGLTLFIKDDKNVAVYLYDKCTETADTLIHILAQATPDTNISISYCHPSIDEYTITELVGAISATKGLVTLSISQIDSALELLLLTIKKDNVKISINNGFVVGPIEQCEYGSVTNIETTLISTKAYNDLVYGKLRELGILVEAEANLLDKTGAVIFIKGDDLKSRIVPKSQV